MNSSSSVYQQTVSMLSKNYTKTWILFYCGDVWLLNQGVIQHDSETLYTGYFCA